MKSLIILRENLYSTIQSAKHQCSLNKKSQRCKVYWDQVEELSSVISDTRKNPKNIMFTPKKVTPVSGKDLDFVDDFCTYFPEHEDCLN